MLEQEIKILSIDTEQVVDILLQHKAKRLFSGFITDMKFEHRSKYIDFSVRIRKKNAQHYVTFKKSLSHTRLKQALEIECLLHNPESFIATIQQQGFVMKRISHKMRVSYAIDQVIFDIDCYEGIPPLLEIESKHEKLITFWIDRLCLQKKHKLLCGVNGLMKFYKKEAA